MSAQQQVIEWLASGETGTSSKTMAFYLGFGVRPKDASYPLDPADFDRCLRLLEAVPALREQIPRLAMLSPEWERLAKRWDEVEKCHLYEVGLGWSKARKAPVTYALMHEVLYRDADQSTAHQEGSGR
jgi:hypothetical protein